MKKFHVDIYTPYGLYLYKDIDYLSVASEKYRLGILADHAELVSTITICEIEIEVDGNKTYFATSGGMIKIKNNQVDLVLQTIESADEIDLDRAKAAKERAERRLSDPTLETIAQTRARLALARANNRINLKNKIQ